MTTFLTFGVYALRISSDLPVQSEYMPLVSIYFNIAITYTLISLIWFAIANYLVGKTWLPKWLELLASKIRNQIRRKASLKMHVDDLIKDDSKAYNLERISSIIECRKCERHSEYFKKSEKKEFDSNLKILNIIVFLFVFIIMIVANLIIWISLVL